MTSLVVVTIAVALLFDVINGFHDAANSIATVVSTRVLSPRIAVLWAAAFNFIALLVFQQGVANTIAKIVQLPAGDPALSTSSCAGCSGAITVESVHLVARLAVVGSHALIGGLSGAGIAYAGVDVAPTRQSDQDRRVHRHRALARLGLRRDHDDRWCSGCSVA